MTIYYRALYMCMFMLPIAAARFSSMQDVITIALQYPEKLRPDNGGYLNPDFSSAYQERSRRCHNNILSWFGYDDLCNEGLTAFHMLCEKVTQHREAAGDGRRQVMRLQHEPGDVLVLWGDLQGAFHSFVRALTDLRLRGIIDDQFVIQQPGYYFVINGNVCGYAGYNLELLQLVLVLMDRNPNRVLCMRGVFEDRHFWEDQGLLQQITSMSGGKSVMVQQISKSVSRFFDTLPDALYIDYPSTTIQLHRLIRISPSGREHHEIDAQWMGDLFAATRKGGHEKLQRYILSNHAKTVGNVAVRVLIKSVDGLIDYMQTNGLELLEPESGATTWSVFSAATDFHREINRFFYDAFVEIELKSQLHEVVITLYNRDIRTNEPFHKASRYTLVSARELALDGSNDVRPKEQEIVIGASLDLSKEARIIGKSLCEGVSRCVSHTNKVGISGDRWVRMVILDDESSPRQATYNVFMLQHEYAISIICFPIGASVIEGYIESIRSGTVAVIFPIIGIPRLRSPDLQGLLYYRPSFEEELNALIGQALQYRISGDAIGFLYEDDETGRGILEVGRRNLESRGLHGWIEIPFTPSKNNYAQIRERLRDSHITALFLCGFPQPMRALLHNVDATMFSRITAYGLSLLGGSAFKEYMHRRGIPFVVSQVVPHPGLSELDIVREYRKAMDDRGLPYDTFSLEGYIATAILIDALAHIEGAVTPHALIAYLTGLQQYRFKGLELTFRPSQRDLGQSVRLDVSEDA